MDKAIRNLDPNVNFFDKTLDNAMGKFENYIDFGVKYKPSLSDKILFCVSKGLHSPRELIQKLQVAKGNLANYCMALAGDGQLTKQVHGRIVKYELTVKGNAYIKKFLEGMK